MSNYGERSTRSKTRAASTVPATPSQKAPSKAGSRAGSKKGGSIADRSDVNTRPQDTYGSKAPDTTATQIRHRATLQTIGSAFNEAVGPEASNFVPANNLAPPLNPIREDPNQQFQQFQTMRQAHDTTGLDPARVDLDGATVRHTPNEPITDDREDRQQTPAESDHESNRSSVGLGHFLRRYGVLDYLMSLFFLACVATLVYHGSRLGANRFLSSDIGGKVKSIAAGYDSLGGKVDSIAAGYESLGQRLENVDISIRHELANLEQRILELSNEQEISATEAKYKMDWFDPRNDAVTLPKYTSPEKMREVEGWMGLFRKKIPFSATPKVIGPFADVKKMWCAPSEEGKAQVTVLLPNQIVPRVLVVEQTHTMDQIINHDTYPKQIELWARVPKGAEPNYDYAPDEDQGKELAAAQALPDNFVLIGRWDYKLHKNLAKQSFNVPAGVITNLVSVRVNSNWGNAEQTCLHKLQLFGEAF